MSVTPIRDAVNVSPTKQQFVDYIAQSYDQWIEHIGSDPSVIVFGFGDDRGNANGKRLVMDEEAGAKCRMLTVSVAHAIRMAVDNP